MKKQIVIFMLLAAVIIIFQGCAYMQAHPTYSNINQATMGVPNTGRLTAQDARDVLDLQEKEMALDKLSSQIKSATESVIEYEGILINKESDSVNFLLDGPDKKSVNVGGRTLLTLKLTPGRYHCIISRGNYILASGIITSGLRLHIVDTLYYKNKRFSKISEDGNIDEAFSAPDKIPKTQYHFFAIAEY